MSKTIATLIILVFGIQLNAQTSDSLAIKNKQKIETIKNRINKAENTINGNTALAAENEQLKLKVKKQQDSIIALNAIIKTLRENQSVQKSDNNSKECVKVYYKSYETTINYAANRGLDSIADMCLKNPKMKIKLIGYADKYGNEEYNLRLSKDRAVSLQNYFITKKKIPAENIEIIGHGSLKDNAAASQQSLNRRVEIYIY